MESNPKFTREKAEALINLCGMLHLQELKSKQG